MASNPSSDQASRRGPRVVLLFAAALVAAATIAAVFKTFNGPLQIVVAVAVGASVNRLFQDSEHAGGWNHIAIVSLSVALGFFATWTAMLLSSNSETSASVRHPPQSAPPHLQILWPPAGIPVGQKYNGVRGIVSDLPQGDTIWLMSQTVGETGSYLMGEPCAIAQSGQWSCPPVYFGTSAPNYQHYYIFVRILDGKAQQQAIQEWGNVRSEGKSALFYPTPIGQAAGRIEVHRIGPP